MIGWIVLSLFLFCLVVRGSLILVTRKRGEFPQITAGVLMVVVATVLILVVLPLAKVLLFALLLVVGGTLSPHYGARGIPQTTARVCHLPLVLS